MNIVSFPRIVLLGIVVVSVARGQTEPVTDVTLPGVTIAHLGHKPAATGAHRVRVRARPEEVPAGSVLRPQCVDAE
jgi:hypothetical protein